MVIRVAPYPLLIPVVRIGENMKTCMSILKWYSIIMIGWMLLYFLGDFIKTGDSFELIFTAGWFVPIFIYLLKKK